MKFLNSIATFIFFAVISSGANALDFHLSGYAGAFNLKHSSNAVFGVESRIYAINNIVVPKIGMLYSSKRESYPYFGFNLELDLLHNKSLFLSPGTSVGVYNKGKGKNLGGKIEFRSGILLEYVCNNKSRVGLGVYHISNAGIYKKNPGAEDVVASYSVLF